MIEHVEYMAQRILNLIYPEGITCDGCGTELTQEKVSRYNLCDRCLDDVVWVKGPTCKSCGGPVPLVSETNICYNCMKRESYLSETQACFLYEGTGKKLIMDLKYNRKTFLGEPLGQMMYDVASASFAEAIDLILSVPLHKSRLSERGFNQMDLMGNPLSEKMGVPYSNTVLIRKVNTPKLKNLNRNERKNVMREAFLVEKESVLGKRILLIDDIFTTGSTMNACAKVLLEAGALNVYGLALSVNFRD